MTESLIREYIVTSVIPEGFESRIDQKESGHGVLVLKPKEEKK